MYGIIQTLLEKEYNVKDTVLIESPFDERTRSGIYSATVLLAITPDKLIIASHKKNGEHKRKRLKTYGDLNIKNIELDSICPLNSITLSVFKRTQRQSLKMVFNNMVTRYYELGKMPNRKIFWKLWCMHVSEIQGLREKQSSPLWPYVSAKTSQSHIPQVRWTDKYVYLGPQRHAEDQIRPVPIPGLGSTNEIKLLYLKPQRLGWIDEVEHRIQYYEEKENATYDYDVYTLSGVPNSNITYTSLLTTVGIIGQF